MLQLELLGKRVSCNKPHEHQWEVGIVKEIFDDEIIIVKCNPNPWGSIESMIKIDEIRVIQ